MTAYLPRHPLVLQGNPNDIPANFNLANKSLHYVDFVCLEYTSLTLLQEHGAQTLPMTFPLVQRDPW